MLRTATRPKWLALLVLALLLLGVGIQLGRWQLAVAHDRAREDVVREAQERPVEPIADVLAPHESFPDDGSGQRISTTGEYDPAQQMLVAGRLLGGREGLWVVDRFVVAETGANLAVVRGWVAPGEAPPAPPSGTVDLVGSLAPGEAPDVATGLPAGQVGSIDLSKLVNRWPGELYNAFAFATEESVGGVPVTLAGIERVPPPLPDISLGWRNLMYAVQWWLFGLFALWMWMKMVRQAAAQKESGPDDEPEHPAAAGPDVGAGREPVDADR